MDTRDIFLRIEDEQNLYDPYDPFGSTINSSVSKYLMEKVLEKKSKDPVMLHIISNQPVDEDRVRDRIEQWFESEREAQKKQRRINGTKQLWFFLIGTLFIALSIILEMKIGVLWYTVLSTIGAFSMWEAASIWIIDNPVLLARKKIFKNLSNTMEVVFETSDSFKATYLSGMADPSDGASTPVTAEKSGTADASEEKDTSAMSDASDVADTSATTEK